LDKDKKKKKVKIRSEKKITDLTTYCVLLLSTIYEKNHSQREGKKAGLSLASNFGHSFKNKLIVWGREMRCYFEVLKLQVTTYFGIFAATEHWMI
jgi:hypothetical protein